MKTCINGHDLTAENTRKNGGCKTCRAVTTKKYRENNKESISRQGKIYVKENKEKRDKYYKDNAAKVSKYHKEYREKNIDKIKQRESVKNKALYAKHWRSRNKEKVQQQCANRRARKLNAFVCAVNRADIFKRDGYICHICGKLTIPTVHHYHPLYPTLDHVVPLSRGGTHGPNNVKCAHSTCNLRKNNKLNKNEEIMISQRGRDWGNFQTKVLKHIEEYTTKQYGDKGEDQATSWSVEMLLEQAKKYLNRYGKNQRPGQEELDLIKACHYIQMAYTKLEEQSNASD